ncbi:hypothetical protein GCM10009835_17570 [Planosporangium flavigriseum]|uniref:Uncharacterized protein n=1 Tax=Planosporangium flavigriseum TaxID=373681 RepID=A0A8J3LQP7_9ACTN|nr:hypothetical protein Pfl04_46410 [Planosporangium flavigriseum]
MARADPTAVANPRSDPCTVRTVGQEWGVPCLPSARCRTNQILGTHSNRTVTQPARACPETQLSSHPAPHRGRPYAYLPAMTAHPDPTAR